MNQSDKSIVIVSGGLDSTTLLYDALENERDVIQALSFDYDQRHKIELEYAQFNCEQVGVPWRLVRLGDISDLLAGSALTDNVEVPEGHYAADNMALTIVPNRNSIMLNIAVGVAIGLGANEVLAGMHAGDHPVYPDCRPIFISRLNDLIRVATETDVIVNTPFIGRTKADIVKLGDRLGVRFEDTWSCYKGGRIHCGKCGTCVERAEAFALAGVSDPTVYEDTEFWKEAVANAT